MTTLMYLLWQSKGEYAGVFFSTLQEFLSSSLLRYLYPRGTKDFPRSRGRGQLKNGFLNAHISHEHFPATAVPVCTPAVSLSSLPSFPILLLSPILLNLSLARYIWKPLNIFKLYFNIFGKPKRTMWNIRQQNLVWYHYPPPNKRGTSYENFTLSINVYNLLVGSILY